MNKNGSTFDTIAFHDAYCLAVAIDEERRRFYGELAEKARESWPRNEFKFLRDEEDRRSHYFLNHFGESGSVDSGNKALSACDPEHELTGFAAREIIGPLAESRGEDVLSNGAKALALGRDVQKRTVKFYEELLRNGLGPGTNDELRDILSKEKEHLNRLNLILSY